MQMVLLLLTAVNCATILAICGGAGLSYRRWKARLRQYSETNDSRFTALGLALGDFHKQSNLEHTALGLALGNFHKQCDAEFASLRQSLSQVRDVSVAWVATQRLCELLIVNAQNMQNQLAGLNYSRGNVSVTTDIILSDLDSYLQLDHNWSSVCDISKKVRTTTRIDGDRRRSAVLVTLGQSNAANHGAGRYVAQHRVDNFNLYDSQCYHAADPLLAASGEGGNFATRLGDKLIEAELFDRVIIAPIGMGGTIVEQWAEDGLFNRRILALIRRLHDAALAPDYILWHQGEGNSGAGDEHGRQYRRRLLEVVSTFRRYGIDAPFFVALATWCGGPHLNAQNIRAGQRGAVNPLLRIYLGPDTDTIGPEHRRDACHFDETGLDLAASLWLKSLADYLNPAQPAEVSGRYGERAGKRIEHEGRQAAQL
jgi:Carbohydrate esterase, sialic acid-specific acetylesterase